MSDLVAFTWDYREQPPMREIAATVRHMSGGRVRMYLPPTETDSYAVVISDRELSAADQEKAWMGE